MFCFLGSGRWGVCCTGLGVCIFFLLFLVLKIYWYLGNRLEFVRRGERGGRWESMLCTDR